MSFQPSVLLIDDEPKIRTFIRVSLQAEGFEYYEAKNGQIGISLHRQLQPDLVILDLGLPDIQGSQVLQAIRRDAPTPILILSARASEEEKVKLLTQGANDYLTKPFGIGELIARVNVLLRDLRNLRVQQHHRLEFDGCIIDHSQHQIWIDQQPISLTKKEFQLLWLLASEPQKLLLQTDLTAEIWGRHHQHDVHYLRILLSHLRKKLGDNPQQPRFIHTETGIGYRFLLSSKNS